MATPYIKFHVGTRNHTFQGIINTGNTINTCNRDFLNEVSRRLQIFPESERIKVRTGFAITDSDYISVQKITVPITFYYKSGKKGKRKVDFRLIDIPLEEHSVTFGFEFSLGEETEHISFENTEIKMKNGQAIPLYLSLIHI